MRRNIIFAFTFYIIAILCLPQYATAQSYMAPAGEIYREEGIASWYGPEFDGRPTASGEVFNSTLFTAAHPSLPFGTFLIVTNRNNNRQVTVKVNDRGPFVASRSIDLSKAAAEYIDMIYTGVAPVIIETLPTSYLQSPPGGTLTAPPAPGPASTPAVPAAPASVPVPISEPQPLAKIPEPEPEAVPEPMAPAPQTATATPGFPYPPITVNVYPSAQPPIPPMPPVVAPAQAQSETQYQQPQVPQYQAQPEPQYQPAPQYQAQPQYQVQPEPPYQQPYPPQYQAQPQYPPQQPYPPQYQAQPQYPPQQQYPPQYQAQPQYPPQYQYPPQPQYQYQPPQPSPSAYPFPAPILPTMPPYQESYLPPQPIQPTLESFPPSAPAVRLIPAITPLPGTTYRLQVGSYKAPRNAVDAFEKLRGVGLNPAYEQHEDYYRVVLAGIPGTEVMSVVDKLGRAGFREAIIRVEH